MKNKKQRKLTEEEIKELVPIFEWLFKADREQNPHLYKKE